MIKLDYFAVLIAVAAIVALSLWPLKSHGEGEHEEHGDAGDQEEHGNAGGHAVQWTFAGTEGSKHWGGLSPNIATCKLGRMKSPIDIASAATGLVAESAGYGFACQEMPLSTVQNDHTVRLNYAPGSLMSIESQEYDLLRFQFYTSSEYTVDGKAFPMEAHFVHKDSHGGLVVIEVMIEEGAANAALANAWAHLPAQKTVETYSRT